MKIKKTNNCTIITLLGLTFIFGWAGNCFTKVFHFQKNRNRRGRRSVSLVIRWVDISSEWSFRLFWGGGELPQFRWESKWLARRFGEMQEAPHGDIWIWNSKFFGTHMDI